MKHLRGFILAMMFFSIGLLAKEQSITVASTTSTQSSGIFEVLLPQFTQQTGIKVKLVAVGTGRAIRLASGGDADVLFSHHRASEERFIADGYGVQRYDVMQNDFVLLGPKSLGSMLAGNDIQSQFAYIAKQQWRFASRGDDSGTHKMERSIWQALDIDPNQNNDQKNARWYREIGAGQGATLNIAIGMNAFVLTDRGTWLNYAHKADYSILSQPQQSLINPYSVMLVNPKKFPHVNHRGGQIFINWLISPEGQKVIAAYRLNGAQVFEATAEK